MGEEVTSEAREVFLFIGWNFFSLNVLGTWTLQVMSLCFFYHNDGMLLHIVGVRVLLVYFGIWT